MNMKKNYRGEWIDWMPNNLFICPHLFVNLKRLNVYVIIKVGIKIWKMDIVMKSPELEE